jgi:hypothetical protein
MIEKLFEPLRLKPVTIVCRGPMIFHQPENGQNLRKHSFEMRKCLHWHTKKQSSASTSAWFIVYASPSESQVLLHASQESLPSVSSSVQDSRKCPELRNRLKKAIDIRYEQRNKYLKLID